MPAATAAAKPCATCRATPSGMNVAVASAIRRLRRAAIAAPRKPTTSVRCSTNGIDPGMPPAKNGRTAISASGRSTITASAPAASHSSRRGVRRRPARPALEGRQCVIIIFAPQQHRLPASGMTGRYRNGFATS